MRARKRSPKPIGKFFGCKEGKIRSENIKQYNPNESSLAEANQQGDNSGTTRTHIVFTNLALFIFLYLCLH